MRYVPCAARTPPKHSSNTVLLLPVLAVLVAASVLAVHTGTPWWLVLGGFAGPDLALALGIGHAQATPGLLPGRAVVPYNLLHRPVTPVLALVAAAVLHSAPLGVVAGTTQVARQNAVGP